MSDFAARPHKLIVIVGFMGSGKSTVARELARLLNSRAIDLDELINEREGRTPGEIIEQSGETEFRRIESETLRQVLNESPGDSKKCIIALGGGAWTIPENRELIEQHNGVSVWLDAPFELCWERIETDAEARPLAPNEHQARMLYAERSLIYALAEIHVPVGPAGSIADTSRKLVAALQTLGT